MIDDDWDLAQDRKSLSDFINSLYTEEQIEAFREEYRAKKRPATNRASKRYNEKYPEFGHMRYEAKKHRLMLYAKQNGLCRWCGEPLEGKYEVDHIIPLTLGGTNEVENLCVCHGRCNRIKGTHVPCKGEE